MLSGPGWFSDRDSNHARGTALFAIGVGRFLPPDDFMEQVDALEGRLHAARPAAGFDAIQMPGEPEWRSPARATPAGVSNPSAPLAAINDLAPGLSVNPVLAGPVAQPVWRVTTPP